MFVFVFLFFNNMANQTILMNVKIATLNCRGLGNESKRTATFDLLKRQKDIQIFLLQETKSVYATEHKWECEWGIGNAIFNSAPHKTRASAGVAILINHPCVKILNHQLDQNGRIISAEIEISRKVFQIINVYAPNTETTKITENNNFFLRLYDYLNPNLPKILAGDFNIVDQPQLDCQPPKRPRKKPTELQILTNAFKLDDPYRAFNPNAKSFTWHSPQYQSRIDRFYLTENIICAAVNTITNPHSDHDIVTLQTKSFSTQPRGKGYWKNNITIYKDKEFLKDLEQCWPLWRSLYPTIFPDLSTWWLDIKNRIKNLVISHSKRLSNESKQKEISLQQNMKRLNKRLDEHPELHEQYLKCKRELAEEQRKQIKKKLRKNSPPNENLNTPEFFKRFANKKENTHIEELVDEYGLPQFTPAELLKTVEKYYSKLYQTDETNAETQSDFVGKIAHKLTEIERNSLETEFKDREIFDAITTGQKNKTPGPDGISREFYQQCWSTIGGTILQLFKSWYVNPTKIPPEIKQGLITLIYKKGDPEELRNYRPISLLNVDFKIFTKILANRLKIYLPSVTHTHQYAQPGKTIFGATTLLRDLLSKCRANNQPYNFLAIDFKKAFDSVDHKWLYRVLAKMDFPPHFSNAVKSINADATSKVLVNGFTTQKICLHKGVRQGDPLSLYLFLIAVEPLINKVNQNSLINGLHGTGNNRIKAICYADDTTFLLKDRTSINETLRILENFSQASGLELNAEKTVCLTSTLNPQPIPGSPINWTTSTLKLLGTTLGHHKTSDAWKAPLNAFKDEMKRIAKHYNTFEGKTVLLKSKLLPLITYQAQTHPLPRQTREILNILTTRFITRNPHTNLTLETLQNPLDKGGYNIPNIGYYADLIFSKQLTQYVRTRLLLTPFSFQDKIIEEQIGRQVSCLWKLPVLNYFPHAASPLPHYHHLLDVIKTYKLTLKEVASSRIRPIYKRIINDPKDNLRNERWSHIHSPIVPNFLKTFNYRLIWNDLPFQANLSNYQPFSINACQFCKIGPDSSQHTLVTCKTVKNIWLLAEKLIYRITGQTLPIVSNLIPTTWSLPANFSHDQKQIIFYIVTVFNHSIWKHRNEVLFDHITPNPSTAVLKKIRRSIQIKYTKESQNPSSFKPTIEILREEILKAVSQTDSTHANLSDN